MRNGLSIGDFARITHLSIKTLRRYHEAGLLVPAQVDRRSGYRYYTTDQVPAAQVIRRFRDLGMPVREIRDVPARPSPTSGRPSSRGHLARLEEQLEATRSAVATLRRLLRPTPATIEVDLRSAPAMPAAAIAEVVDRDKILVWYADAADELDRVLDERGLTPTGPRGGLYDNEIFTADHGAATVYVPVGEAPASGRVRPFVVPPAELAVTVHPGPHDDIDVTYGALGSYVADHAMTVAGPVREVYLVGPRDTADPAAWRTEIGWPIFRTRAFPVE